MRSVQNSFLKKFLPHPIKEAREASKSVRCERVPEPRTGHDLSHAAPNLLIKAFVPEHSVAVWSIENELHLNDPRPALNMPSLSLTSRSRHPQTKTKAHKHAPALAPTQTAKRNGPTKKEAGANPLRPLKLCGQRVGGMGLAANCRRLSQLGGHRAACIKIKFTSIRRRLFLEEGKMVNRGSGPESSLAPRPLHPFTCPVGDDR
jgi:hypothetical protein